MYTKSGLCKSALCRKWDQRFESAFLQGESGANLSRAGIRLSRSRSQDRALGLESRQFAGSAIPAYAGGRPIATGPASLPPSSRTSAPI
jgi:hypothetical protein